MPSNNLAGQGARGHLPSKPTALPRWQLYLGWPREGRWRLRKGKRRVGLFFLLFFHFNNTSNTQTRSWKKPEPGPFRLKSAAPIPGPFPPTLPERTVLTSLIWTPTDIYTFTHDPSPIKKIGQKYFSNIKKNHRTNLSIILFVKRYTLTTQGI